MTVRVYSNFDSGAPTLQGVAGGAYPWADGSLLNLLDKCLVTGYGTQTAAGWSRSFTGTSKGVFRQGAGCLFYFRCLDDGSLTAGAREATFRGAETATDVDLTGVTQLFPTVADIAGGILLRKSDTADTVQRQWVMYADNRTFYLFTVPVAGSYLAGFYFGDFVSLKPGDLFNCGIAGRVTSAAVDALTNETLDLAGTGTGGLNNLTGHRIARGYNGLGGATSFGVAAAPFHGVSGANAFSSSGLAFPNPTDQLMYLSRCYVLDGTTPPVVSVRGYLRGLWSIQHSGAVIPFDYTFAGTGGVAGKTFKALGLRTGNNANGRYTLETSDTWDG